MLGAADFEGVWTLERKIKDRKGAMNGTLAGQAVLAGDGADRLIYREIGLLTLDSGAKLQAERRYRWEFATGRVQISFDDGRPFHDFMPQGQAAGSDHPCGADHYSVLYDFTRWPQWQAVWTVTGPRKDYTSTSLYRREAATDLR